MDLVIVLDLLNSMYVIDVDIAEKIIKILQNTEVRELGLRDIIAVAGGVVIAIVVWVLILKGGAA